MAPALLRSSHIRAHPFSSVLNPCPPCHPWAINKFRAHAINYTSVGLRPPPVYYKSPSSGRRLARFFMAFIFRFSVSILIWVMNGSAKRIKNNYFCPIFRPEMLKMRQKRKKNEKEPKRTKNNIIKYLYLPCSVVWTVQKEQTNVQKALKTTIATF